MAPPRASAGAAKTASAIASEPVAAISAGEEVQLTVVRGEASASVTVTLGER